MYKTIVDLVEKYDTIIIDEAHERSLNIDFLLGYLKRILPQRPDLKLIVTSATIDLESFSWVRAVMTTSAPILASSLAVTCPMPDVPPVTRHNLPIRLV